jgi:hypothetical protein
VRCVDLLSNVLNFTPKRVMQTVTMLAELGVADAPAALARNTGMLGMSCATLLAKANVLQRHGLDAGALISAVPHVLSLSADTLEEKLQWLTQVAECRASELQTDCMLSNSVHERLRPRLFLAMQLGVDGRRKVATMMSPSDAMFLKRVLHGAPAASWSVEEYAQYIASPAFVLYMDSEEAALRAKHAAAVACGAAPLAGAVRGSGRRYAARTGAERKPIPSAGVHGAKDAAGRPLLDPRTVALLVAEGFGDKAAVETLLHWQQGASRVPYDTAMPALTWLTAALEGCSKRVNGNDVAGVTLVVRKNPFLLRRSVATLQTSWDFLQAPAPAGFGFSREQAYAAVISRPIVLLLSPKCIMDTATTLAELGVADARGVLVRHPSMACLSSETLCANAKVLRDHGLDVGAATSAMPPVLSLSADTLEEKLQWLLHVAGCSAGYLQGNPVLLTYSLPKRVRQRFFLARQLGVEKRSLLMSYMAPTDAVFLKRALRDTEAARWSVAAYKQYIASPEFTLRMDNEEAALRAQHAAYNSAAAARCIA